MADKDKDKELLPDPKKSLIVGHPDGSPIGVYIGLYEHGYNTAQKQGGTKSDEAVMNQLAAFAESSARVQTAAPFDRANPADDRLHEERQHQLERRPEFEHQVTHARMELKLAEERRDEQGEAPEAPETPYLAGLIGTLAMSATVTLALNDVIFARAVGDDPIKAFTAAALFGTVLAGGVSLGILGSAKHESTSWTHIVWVLVGLLFGVGLLVLRLAAANDERGKLLAYGFAITEVVIVASLELCTQGLRRAWQVFRRKSESYGVVNERVETTKRYLKGRQDELTECEKRITQTDEEVKVRTSLVLATPLVCAAARETILRGYQDGLAANYGYLNGAISTTSSRAEVIAKVGALPSVASVVGRLTRSSE